MLIVFFSFRQERPAKNESKSKTRRAPRKLLFEGLEDRRVFANTAPEEMGIVAREFAPDAVAPAEFSFVDPAGNQVSCVALTKVSTEPLLGAPPAASPDSASNQTISPVAVAPTSVRHEIAFVDTAVLNYQQLVEQIASSRSEARQIDVVLLDRSRDGVEQISQALATRSDLDAVHLISHGTEGAIQLGSIWLSNDNLPAYSATIADWGKAMKADADLLVYGCDVAQLDDGKALVDKLARLTGDDVAASEDLTGSADLGGDWTLEYANGRIDTSLAIDVTKAQTWQGTLANNAPVLSGANDLTAILENASNNPGTLVSALIAGKVTDADPNALTGIAVIDVDNNKGDWQYSTDGGGTWNSFGSPASTTARLLAANANTFVRFVPNANWFGTVNGGITFRAWDQTTGTAGGTASTSPNHGGSTAFSNGTASANIRVAPLNNAPGGTDKTITTLEDTAYTFTAADFGFSDASDSPANSFLAVKITTLPLVGTLTDNGVAVSAGQFITLADITGGLLKFTPAANANGTAYASFTFQVQDNGGTIGGGIDLDQSPNTITVNVTSVNDAPSGTNKTI
ncbi:MAG TPA: DUF4347 domain-containing protein, partial [Pirellulales bacterium]|nr:DUF4347 domain-containing protein [Pirellulales bacterium]